MHRTTQGRVPACEALVPASSIGVATTAVDIGKNDILICSDIGSTEVGAAAAITAHLG